MKAIISVKDNRTFNGMGTRSEEVKNIEDAVKFAKRFKNRVYNEVTVMSNPVQVVKF